MKTASSSKKASAKKSSAKVKDLKAKKNPKGGLTRLILPAPQPRREP
jgi:hypothetical protein